MLNLRDFLKRKIFIFVFVLSIAFIAFASVAVISNRSFLNYEANYQDNPPKATTQHPFEFTISLEKTTSKLGEPINMIITLKNVGEENETITFSTMPNPSPYWFWCVYNESQQPVFYHKYMLRLPALEDVTLQPGESMQRKFTWYQTATDSGQQVPPGIYYLTAKTGFIHNEEEVNFETRSEILIRL